jgi:Cytochrome c3
MKLGARLWILWIVSALAGVAVLAAGLAYGGPIRAQFLIGKTTSGHHQIELACGACHTSAFGGKEEMQKACESCHAEELKHAKDSHPAKKFTDPRNADRLAKLNATQCITCHTEHRPEITLAMGVTLPGNYCRLCHEDIGKERPSHKGLAFTTCADAGCHNFHDNRALYEDFLERHAHEPETKANPFVKLRRDVERAASEKPPLTTISQADAPPAHANNKTITADWLASKHARAGINCSGCHAPKVKTPEAIAQGWIARPGHKVCATCHAQEVKTFTEGKHGMRLADGMKSETKGLFGLFKDKPLGPMRPEIARISLSPKMAKHEIGCSTCHKAHAYNTATAEVEACLTCHVDEHSKAYRNSPHYRLWRAEKSGKGAKATGVTCATCHLPRFMHEDPATYEEVLAINHNQNANLRPNEKMLRSVCMDCHGLGFGIDALADPKTIRNNFSTRPSIHVESIDWVIKRLKAREGKKKQ